LWLGIVDYLENKGIKVFGPSMKASQLEGSKIFMKNFCKKFNIPTAKYFEVKSLTEAKKGFI
jgi:phosphoribosylamine--glycine ligase